MKRSLVRPWLVTLAVLSWAVPGFAVGDKIVISTGREGGSYHSIGRRLSLQLIVAKQAPPTVLTSQGSMENLAHLGDPNSGVSVALAQTDALSVHLRKNPAFSDAFFVLGDMGRECAFLVTTAESALRSAADLRREGAPVLSVDAPDSGSSTTFHTLAWLDPTLAATKAVDMPTMEALLQMKLSSGYSKLDGVFFVQRPKRLSPPIEHVLDAPETYRFVPIVEGDMPNAKLPDGSPVYTFERVNVGGRDPRHREIETLCTRGLLLGSRKKLGPEARDSLSKLMLEVGDRIAGEDE